MTTYPLAWPTAPAVASEQLRLKRAQAVHQAIVTGQQQVVANFAQWQLAAALPPLSLAQAEPWAAFFNSLNGRIGTFNYSPKQSSVSTLSGITVAVAVSAYATTVQMAGWAASAPSQLRAGQFLQIGSQLIQILTAPATADGAGKCTIEFAPFARSTWSVGFGVECDAPLGLFRLAGDIPAFTQTADGLIVFSPLEAEEAL